jgi:hypothetical protein
MKLFGFSQWKKARAIEQDMRSFAIGMNSTVDFARDLHIVFLDFDNVTLEDVWISVEECQGFWGLCDAHIFKTKHGYHAIFFYDLVPYERLRMIVDFARSVDVMFKYISKYYSHKTLRVAGKYQERDIEFIGIMKGLREPTDQERELGDLKREEHRILTNYKVVQVDKKAEESK